MPDSRGGATTFGPFGASETGPGSSSGPARRTRRFELGVTLALPLFLFVVFLRSPTSWLWDSKYAVLTSEAILEGDGFDLSRFLRPRDLEETSSEPCTTHRTWQLERAKGRLLYLFPPGTPLLSLPLVAALRATGMTSLDADGHYNPRRESRLQLTVASAVAALTALLILRIARREVPLLPAAAVALLAGLGSSLWTIASRDLWSHTWSALLLGAGWLELLRWEEGRAPRPLLLGAIASAAFWVRPSNAWIALAFTAFVALRHRPHTLKLIVSGAVGLAAYCAWSLHYYGALFASYVTMRRPWAARLFLDELAESLISARHGLLVYSPILLAAAYVLLRHGVPESRRPLALLGAVVVSGHLGLHAASGAVWGPDGPRLQHDVIPVLAWLGAVALRRHLELAAPAGTPRRRLRPLAALVALSLAGASVLASIGSVFVGQRDAGDYRAQLEASYPRWDPRRLPQYLGIRSLAAVDPLPPRKRAKWRHRADSRLWPCAAESAGQGPTVRAPEEATSPPAPKAP